MMNDFPIGSLSLPSNLEAVVQLHPAPDDERSGSPKRIHPQMRLSRKALEQFGQRLILVLCWAHTAIPERPPPHFQ